MQLCDEYCGNVTGIMLQECPGSCVTSNERQRMPTTLRNELVTLQRTGVRCPRHRRQSRTFKVLPFEKPSSGIKGITHSKRTKSLWKGPLAENKESRRWVYCLLSSWSFLLIVRCAHIGDIILYDSHLVVYKHSLDLILYFIAGSTENEVMLYSALTSLTEALTMLLRNSLEKRGVLENLDLVLLCLDETIDDGYGLLGFYPSSLPSLNNTFCAY